MEKYVPRNAESTVRKYLELFNGVIITGPRQAGKTTLAKRIGEEVNAEFVPLDHPLELEYLESKPYVFAEKHKAKYLILDEAQYAENAGRAIKYLADVEGRKIIATGSSAELLSQKVISELVGRVGIVELFPFSIDELLRAKNMEKAYDEEIREVVKEYIRYGGFPRAVLSEEENETILQHLLITMIKKDAARIAETSEQEVMRVVLAVAARDGNTVEYSAVARDAGVKYHAVKKITDALEASYVVYVTRPYHKNKSSELRKAPKIYFTDTGIKHAVENRFGEIIKGSDVETAVLSELLKMGLKPKYWRTKGGAEVDFVVETGLDTIPIEVKTNWPEKIPAGLREFINTYEEQTPIAIVVDLSEEVWKDRYKDVTVVKCPLWRLKETLQKYTR